MLAHTPNSSFLIIRGVKKRQCDVFCFVFWIFQLGIIIFALGLGTETVEGAALALQRVDDVHGGHGLAASVLRVGHSVTDDSLKEHLENATRLLVDHAADALDNSTTCEAADGRLRDPLDVIT